MSDCLVYTPETAAETDDINVVVVEFNDRAIEMLKGWGIVFPCWHSQIERLTCEQLDMLKDTE